MSEPPVPESRPPEEGASRPPDPTGAPATPLAPDRAGTAPRHGAGLLPRGARRRLLGLAVALVVLAPPAWIFLASHEPASGPNILDLDELEKEEFRQLIPSWMGDDEDVARSAALTVFASVGVVGLILGAPLLAVPVVLLLRRRPRRPIPDPAAWGLLDIAAITIVFLAANLLAGAFLQSPPDASPGSLDLLANAVVWSATILVLFTWLHHVRGRGIGDLGLHGEGLLGATAWGGALWVAALPFLFGVLSAWLFLFILSEAPLENHPIAPVLDDPGKAPALYAASVLTAVLVAPFAEEVLFRGFLYGALRSILGPWLAMVATSALFAAMHPLAGFYSILMLGLLFAFLYERTGNLFAPIIVHATHNGVLVLITALQQPAG